MTERFDTARRWIRRGFPVRTVLNFSGVAPSTYYDKCKRKSKPHARCGGRPILGFSVTRCGHRVSDQKIKDLLKFAISQDAFPYGYRKLNHWLRRSHRLVISPKKVYRLCREMGILLSGRRRRPWRHRKIARIREVTRLNELWVTDVKYGFIEGENRFFFVQTILDVTDRMVIDYHIGLTCTAIQVVSTLKGALERRRKDVKDHKPTVRSDNGPQFLSRVYREACHELGVEVEYIPVRTPNKNAHIESFHSLLESECLGRHSFSSFAEAYMTVVRYMDYYNNRRIHGSLGYRTPREYHEDLLNKRVKTNPIKL